MNAMIPLPLKAAPRLYVTPEIAANLKRKLHSPFLQQQAAQVLHDARRLVRTKPLPEGVSATWQVGTRTINTRLQCLTTAWVLTHDARYRQAALRHLAGLTEWRQISCETRANTPPEPILPFCLSYGELAATVGLMFDLFHATLTPAERQVFAALLDKFLMRAAVRSLDDPPWWANKSWSNWNGVCAGGMGLMALAFYDDHPDAPRLIPFVETSLGEYFKQFIANGGGCPEGTGYWNYGMNYAIRYLLSWENATGQKHPALGIKELADSLYFPIDFTGISFGDNDGWQPSCFFFQLAHRLNQRNAALRAAAYLTTQALPRRHRDPARVETGDLLYAADVIPTAAEIRRLQAAHQKTKQPVARVYPGMDWAVLADDEAFPSLRLAVRGGSNKIAGHGMLDLLGIRCRVNGALMITDQQDGGYMATTFGKRGHEIYGRSAHSKSTLFVDGLACAADATADRTALVQAPDIRGIRIDASHAFIPRWNDIFIGRLVLLVENAYWLVIDQVSAANPVDQHWVESRFHTLAAAQRGKNSVTLQSGPQRMQLTFAALGPGVIQESRGMPAQPRPQTTIFRWMSAVPGNDHLHVVALNPGSRKLGLTVRKPGDGHYVIEVTRAGRPPRRIRLNARLEFR